MVSDKRKIVWYNNRTEQPRQGKNKHCLSTLGEGAKYLKPEPQVWKSDASFQSSSLELSENSCAKVVCSSLMTTMNTRKRPRLFLISSFAPPAVTGHANPEARRRLHHPPAAMEDLWQPNRKNSVAQRRLQNQLTIVDTTSRLLILPNRS